LNDKHSFRANVIGINNALNYAEYANEDQNESKVSQLSQKNLGYGGSWKAQWTNAFRTEIVTYFSRYNIDATDYRVPTDQLLTEANEVQTGTKLNYKANSISLYYWGIRLMKLGCSTKLL
jgi:hypothetical protein